MLRKVLKKLPPVARVIAERDALQAEVDRLRAAPAPEFAPAGHFYSPVPSAEDQSRREGEAETPLDVDLNEAGQEALLRQLAAYYPDRQMPAAKTPGLRFHLDQHFFRHSDAFFLYALMRHFRPQRYIEVGSGFSSAVALDTSERFLGSRVACTFIEPYPDRFRSLSPASDPHPYTLLERPLQDVPAATFASLQANDILFIDSSHVCKVGSDVNRLLFHVLPRLRTGVLIHIHDIFYPFEYPTAWFREGRYWNETYLVRAFLQNNPAYEIVLFGSFAGRRFRALLESAMPACLQDTGGSLWLRKK